MPLPIVRPDIHTDRLEELQSYLFDQWDRAKRARTEQVENKLPDWEKAYRGIPRERVRTIPWYNASNIVVQIIRLFVDTYVARTQGIIASTRPIYTVDRFPREQRDAVELYLHRKAFNTWNHLQVCGQMLSRGTKQGTAVVKQVWSEETAFEVSGAGAGQVVAEGEWEEREVTKYLGPLAKCIPFEDFAVYPITANNFDEVEISFHRLRFTVESALRKLRAGKWFNITEDEIQSESRLPQDIKRLDDQERAGIHDQYLKEFEIIECFLEWPITNDFTKNYRLVVLLNPGLHRVVDLYFDPVPVGVNTFFLYKPNPRDDFFYGESWPEILGSMQEEVSTIHNDRRNASFLASAPVFKRRSGATVPNPSTTWYPGKVWDLEDMDDFEVVSVGRQLGDLLTEEMQVINIAERIMGIGAPMQGMSAGQSDKRGVYNTGGVLGIISEGNQRQDTNISDARSVLSAVGKNSFLLQARFGADDPSIESFPPEIQENIRAALQEAATSSGADLRFQIKASNAGANKEIEKASLLQMSNVLAQYSQTLQQLAPMFLSMPPQSPMKPLIQKILEMAAWMAKRLLKAFDEYDAEGVIPDVRQLLAPTGPQGIGAPPQAGAVQPVGPGAMEPSGPGGPGGLLTRENLQALGTMAGGLAGNGRV